MIKVEYHHFANPETLMSLMNDYLQLWHHKRGELDITRRQAAKFRLGEILQDKRLSFSTSKLLKRKFKER